MAGRDRRGEVGAGASRLASTALGEPGARRRYLVAAAAVAATTLAMLAARDALGVLNVLLIFLLLTIGVALLAGDRPAAFAAVLAFLAFDFFFIPPYHGFTVAAPDHVLALFVYLGVAIGTARLVASVRARTEAAEREQRRTALLYELNAALIGDVTLDAMLATIAERLVSVYGAARCRILLPDEGGALVVRAAFPTDAPGPAPTAATDRQRLAMAAWAMEHRQPVGLNPANRRVRVPHGIGRGPTAATPLPSPPDPDVLYLPIATAERTIGVLEVADRPAGGRSTKEAERLLGSFAAQAALALERARLTEEAARAAALVQSDELKSALLAAVSHDLRTPLAAIKASATSLLDDGVAWRDEDRADFLRAIDEETDRLALLVGNLLDLSRIEGGALRPDREWYDVAELVADVAARLAPRVGPRELRVEVEPDLPLVWFDYVEIAQVLTNLAENALKYTPPGTPITLAARAVPGAVELAVHDRGPGIPPRARARLFDKFYRGAAASGIPGTGIGLTISRGLVEAHGGRIWAEERPGGGTSFRFELPLGGPPEGVAQTPAMVGAATEPAA
jgi:two-component system sensor histidine kinase KdpD